MMEPTLDTTQGPPSLLISEVLKS